MKLLTPVLVLCGVSLILSFALPFHLLWISPILLGCAVVLIGVMVRQAVRSPRRG